MVKAKIHCPNERIFFKNFLISRPRLPFKEKIFKKENILNIPFYMLIYIAVYPFIMIGAICHIIKGKRVWR